MMLREVLTKVKIKEVMVKDIKTLSPDLSLASVFQDYFLKYGVEGFLVAKNKTFVGAVTINELKKIPKTSWPKTKLKSVMIPAKQIPIAKETDQSLAVLGRLSKQGIGFMPIVKNKKLVGAVSLSSLMRYVQLHAEVN